MRVLSGFQIRVGKLVAREMGNAQNALKTAETRPDDLLSDPTSKERAYLALPNSLGAPI